MTVLKAGVSTFGLLSEPDAAHNGLSYLTVHKDNAVAFVYHPVTCVPAGATLTSAILRLYTYGSWGITPTVTVQAADAAWGGSSLTWNESPGGTGTTTTVTHASAADGDLFQATVTTQVLAMLAAGTNFGFVIARTDVGASKAFYSHVDPVYAPTLELTWTTVPTAPTGLKPSGGRVVATNKPTVQFDAQDVTYVKVQIDASAGNFSAPVFDSGWVVATTGELDLSTTAYGGIAAGVDVAWRAFYKNSAGVASPASAISHMTYRAYPLVIISNPLIEPTNIVLTDTPTITATSSTTPVASWRVEIGPALNPTATTYRTTFTGASLSVALPVGIITDSSDQTLTVYAKDTYDREAVPGYPIEAVKSRTFSFQDSGAVPPVEEMWAEQIGVSSFIVLHYSRATDPEKWVIRRDDQIIFSADITDTRFSQDSDGLWTFNDYTASGNVIHRYRVSAKVDQQVSANDPLYDIITSPGGINIADPETGDRFFLAGDSKGSYGMGEVSAFYEPLRGTEGVRVFQSQRGYEGDIDGQIVGLPDIGNATTDIGYRNLLRIKAAATKRPMVVVIGDLAFMATLSKIDATQGRTTYGAWDVSLHFEQQGTTLWFGGIDGAVPPEATLLGEYDYEEGVNNTAVTTASPDVVSVTGTPKYFTASKVHGVMGWNCPATAGGGAVVYSIPTIGQAQVYFTPRSSSDLGYLVKIRSSGAGQVAAIILRSAGDLGIVNSADALQVSSHGVYGWRVNQTARVVVQWLWSTGVVWVGCYLYASPESTVASDFFSGSFAAATAPDEIYIGNGTDKKSTDYDSVSLYAGIATLPEPLLPGESAEPLRSYPGSATPTTMEIASEVLSVASINFAYSTTLTAGDPATPTYAGVQTVGDGNIVKHPITGLTANTQYYGKLSTGAGVFVGDLIKFKTLPAASGTTLSVKMSVGSCQRNAAGSTSTAAWDDILAWGPDLNFNLGDYGYWGGHFKDPTDWTEHAEKFSSQTQNLTAMKQVLEQAPFLYMADDHEYSSNNGDSLEGTPDGIARKGNIEAIQRMLSMYPLGDARSLTSKRGLYGSFMIGAHIRVIMLDAISLDRSAALDADSGSKSFLGAEQDSWLRTTLQGNAAVNLIFCGKSLVGTSVTSGTRTKNDEDKPWNYPTWRSSLVTWIGANTQANGQPIKIAWIGADRHANAYLHKTTGNTTIPGHPCYIASGYEQDSLNTVTGETYTAQYGFGLGTEVRQYVRLTVSDDNAGTVTLVYLSREVHNLTTNAIIDGATYTTTWSYP